MSSSIFIFKARIIACLSIKTSGIITKIATIKTTSTTAITDDYFFFLFIRLLYFALILLASIV